MKRFIPLCLASALVAVLAASPALSQSDEIGALKNVQKLKGLEKPELVKLMKTYAQALGKKCDFCHVKGDFSADDKPEKLKAREMIDLVQTLNAKYFNKPDGQRATCFMCHRGSEDPQLEP